ncbi:polyphosphate kinase 2 family protein [Acuticoccus sp. I52.16.1]|uniref:polyphosphate kinase 2 family protein n=1 Tax=Acuticoccus sp. I52.16.1 TaxID=2928472 RepID=UPI001FCF9879|nr:polyphosphate kinase 2 family protein [Acuticoccus sp. I52.16.1]UOM33485.1 polyphosphate kinase 2 family protein [Acuticoccus sp. I52.16.1]
MDVAKLAARHRVEDGKSFRLDTVDPYDHDGIDIEKDEAKDLLAANVSDLSDLQERLYAERKTSLLVILQAMDTAGKDSAIEHVMSGMNPQGFQVRSFKSPSARELDHDFLWRHAVALPARGHIGIFNRSHYEEVLAVRVHPEYLANQRIAFEPSIWKKRFKSIRNFERHLSRNGTVVLKFFLHITPDEQARRLLDRIETPAKNWKFAFSDLEERALWGDYMAAYDDMIRNTARDYAPWHVVPSNNKWYSRLVISCAILEALRRIDPHFPDSDLDELERMHHARETLMRELDEAQPQVITP